MVRADAKASALRPIYGHGGRTGANKIHSGFKDEPNAAMFRSSKGFKRSVFL